MMRIVEWSTIACTGLLGAGLSTSCSVEQTREAQAPDVDVAVDPGRLPQYNVNWADVEVGTSERTVEVPVIRIERQPRQLTVPYIDIEVPGARQVEDRTVTVSADVPHAGFAIEIWEVRAAGDDLWVVARLVEQRGSVATQAITRVSDQVIISSPDDVDVRSVIVGVRPATDHQQHRYVPSMDDVNRMVPAQARVIYRRESRAAD